jgi:phosphoribosyl-ATP pyrophosphohydrolase
VVIAALAQTKERLVDESADLLYHLMVLWAEKGVKPSEVMANLEARHRTPPAPKRE